jgi:hypothetical protein
MGEKQSFSLKMLMKSFILEKCPFPSIPPFKKVGPTKKKKKKKNVPRFLPQPLLLIPTTTKTVNFNLLMVCHLLLV